MTVPELDHEAIVRLNTEELGSASDGIPWVSAEGARRSEETRKGLLARLGRGVSYSFKGSKPHLGPLSPGCTLCGEGSWSCLFVNNLCNASCFFCPAPQDDADMPGTSTLTFSDPLEYAEYVERFGFRGVSISGGEPLVHPERTLSFIEAVRRRLGGDVYLWMYTNGKLLSRELASRLRDAGLDEIRFNIAASGYDLEAVRTALKIIPTVTVEIPAVPEDLETLEKISRTLSDLGVRHLNLHQIRCTRFNKDRLAKRGYTFLHGPLSAVLESELAALSFLAYAQDTGLAIPVNYCSAIYRHRFQARASRRRWARYVAKPFETVTEAGLIRTVHLEGEGRVLSSVQESLRAGGTDGRRWDVSNKGRRMSIDADLLGLIHTDGLEVKVAYSLATIRPTHSYLHPFTEITLSSGRTLVIERATCLGATALDAGELRLFTESFPGGGAAAMEADLVYERAARISGDPSRVAAWKRIIQAESIRSGLLEYY
ncbi:MAG TPA: radical SAM protein [Deltaproteobacteria bacterium]|nr:radical SAM protein [Deltaproteobacteria bacterium]HOM29370.1 radical SAM protein [Deltaproteobacteria bacterium]